MALLNNIYVLCEDEQITNNVSLTNHPTESGLPLSDTVKKEAIQLSISGRIVGYENFSAKDIVNKLNELKSKGSWIEFRGVNALNKLQISNFIYIASNRVNGGYDFSMTLTENRVAKSSYTPSKEQPKDSTPKELSVGDLVKFKGGYVFYASDSKASATRKLESICKLTKISSLENARNPYHLISQDCIYGSQHYVYGWVRAKDVQMLSQPSTNGTTNLGLQAAVSPIEEAVYHTVKKGDTLYRLATVTYARYGVKPEDIRKNNPGCFTNPKDYRTLIVGSRLRIV